MKILFNASMYGKNPPGVGVYIREVWNNLYKILDGKETEYRCYVYNLNGLNNPVKLSPIKLPFALDVLLKKFTSLHRITWNLFFLPFAAKKYDLIYSFSSHGSPFIKNQIITIHDLICFRFPKQHKFQFLYFKYILPSIIRACKKIVVVSEFTKNEVLKYYRINPHKVVLITNGGDHFKIADTFFLSEEEKRWEQKILKKEFFLTVGASYPHKNTERLIEAISRMPVKKSLVVVGGENKYSGKLRRLANKKKVDVVIFTRYVSQGFLNLLYKKCIANVYISLYEGFGFPPFEAALNSKLSVVSNSGALPEIFSDTVYFVNPQNVKEISKALTFITSPGFSAFDYQKKFPQLINKYKWCDTAGKIAALISSEPATK